MCNFSIPLLDCVVYQSCVFHNLFIKIGEKTIKNDQKRSKNDLTSHTQLHRHVRLFYPLTYIFGTLRDWTHKHNAAIFDSLSIWTKKDTRQEEKNVVGFLFFHFENRQTKSDLLGTIVECLKRFNEPLFSASFEIVYLTTTSRRLSQWFEEIKKLEGPTSRWYQRKFFSSKNVLLKKRTFEKSTFWHDGPLCGIFNVSI